MFGGIGLLQGLIAALGAALFVGNIAALLRPPQAPRRDPRSRTTRSTRVTADPRTGAAPKPTPPALRRGQAMFMAALGFVIMMWCLASLFSR